MASQWFYRRGSEEVGPVTFQDLMELVRTGTLKEDHRVRRDLSQEWMAARDVIGLFRAAGAGTAQPAPDAKTALPATPVAAAPAAAEAAPAPTAATSAAPAAPLRKAGPSPAARLVTAGVLAAVAIGAGFGLRWIAQNHARLLGKRDAFREEFDGKFLDPTRWMTYRGAVKVDPKDGQLVVSAKSVLGQESRGAIEALVSLEGDFDVRIDYRLVKFPTPREKDLKAELHLNGPDGPLAIIRGLNLPQGDWYCAWSDHTADAPKKVVWKQKRTRDQGGSLGLKRTGRQLAFLTAAPGKELEAIETIHYGSSEIKTIAVSVWMPPTESPVEVAFDNFTIDADRIVRPTAQPRYAWLVSAAIVLAGLAIGAWWYQRPGRRARPRRRTGTGPAGSIPAS